MSEGSCQFVAHLHAGVEVRHVLTPKTRKARRLIDIRKCISNFGLQMFGAFRVGEKEIPQVAKRSRCGIRTSYDSEISVGDSILPRKFALRGTVFVHLNSQCNASLVDVPHSGDKIYQVVIEILMAGAVFQPMNRVFPAHIRDHAHRLR